MVVLKVVPVGHGSHLFILKLNMGESLGHLVEIQVFVSGFNVSPCWQVLITDLHLLWFGSHFVLIGQFLHYFIVAFQKGS